MSAPVGVLAVRWVAELALSPNGMHEIRAGAVNARERPLIGYAATYTDACEIAEAHNNRAAVAELVEAAKGAQPYLMPSDAGLYRNAAFMSRADLLRQQADESEAKDAAIRRFNAALAKFGEG